MDRIDEATERYLSWWNDQYARVNDVSIVAWAVKEAMGDIESWIEGSDPKQSREGAGFSDWSRDELISLYRALSSSAAFFEYTPHRYRSAADPP
tara:strand:- start:232 stop:513 length:282 start_codon:yes stop_codon:yes gene_type:complete